MERELGVAWMNPGCAPARRIDSVGLGKPALTGAPDVSKNAGMRQMGRRQVLRGLGGTAVGLAAVATAGCGRVNVTSAPARRAPGTLIWRVKSGPANTSGLGGQSVLVGSSMVYVAGTPLADGDCVTCAFDAATGKLAWRIAASAGPLLTAGPGAVFGFQMTADQNGTEVAAFSADTGRRMWTHHVGEFLDSAGDDGWAGYSHGTVYIAGSRNPEETTSKTFVGALDARTGRRLWGVTLTGMLQYPALSDGIVYASTASRVVALNAVTGTRLWESADVGANTGYLWVENRVVYGYLLTGIHGTVPFALDAATGKRLEHGFGSPVSVGGLCFIVQIGGQDGAIEARHAGSGTLAWKHTIPDGVGSLPVANGTILYIGDDGHGMLYALYAATGSTAWTYSLSASIVGMAVSNGILYAADINGNVCALQTWR